MHFDGTAPITPSMLRSFTQPSPLESAFQQIQRLRQKRAVGGIFARGFLLTLTSRLTTAAHSRSSRGRLKFSLGTATRHQTLWPAPHVSAHIDSYPSICVDVALR